MKCHFCKESGFAPEEGIEFYNGFACDFCRTPCAKCHDWLGNESETIVDGQRWHSMCLEDYRDEIQAVLEFIPSRRTNANE